MENTELLQAISSMLDEKLEPINKEISSIKKEMNEKFDKLEQKVNVIEQDVKEIKAKSVQIGDKIIETTENLDKRLVEVKNEINSIGLATTNNSYNIAVLNQKTKEIEQKLA